MNALCAASLQPASPESSLATGGRHTAAWQKELDRACGASWFHGALAQLPSRAAESAGSHPASSVHVAQAFPGAAIREAQSPHAVCSPPARVTAVCGQQSARAEWPVGPKTQHLATDVAVNLHRNDAASKPTGDGSRHAVTVGHFAPDGGEAARVRIHAEAGGEGVTVWIGIDGDAALVARRSADLLEELLRQARETGQLLSAVICNGTPIHGGSSGKPPLYSQSPGDTP